MEQMVANIEQNTQSAQQRSYQRLFQRHWKVSAPQKSIDSMGHAKITIISDIAAQTNILALMQLLKLAHR